MVDSLPPGVVILNGGGSSQQAPQAARTFPSQQPVTPMRPLGNRDPGNQQPLQHRYPVAGQNVTPWPVASLPRPPVPQMPQDRGQRSKVEIIDLRKESMTEATAQEQLSSYVIMRLEKADVTDEVDEAGYRVDPTWQNVRHIHLDDISQTEATRKVRDLERSGPVANKKAALGIIVQRQVERAQERLQATEDDQRYQYILAQFESKYGQRTQSSSRYVSARKNDKTYLHTSKSSKKGKSAKQKERVAVTAYFKRTPRPGEDVLRMLQERTHGPQPWVMHPPPAPFYPATTSYLGDGNIQNTRPSQALPPPPPLVHPQFGYIDPRLAVPAAQKGSAVPPGSKASAPGARPKIVVTNQAPKIKILRSQSSRSSVTSYDSGSSEGSEVLTSPSSLGSSFKGGHKRKQRGRVRYPSTDYPESYGIEIPRRHTRNDCDDYVPQYVGTNQRMAASLELENERRIGYLEGLEQAASIRVRDTGLPPRIIQSHPGVRRLTPHEARRQIYVDEMDHLEEEFGSLRFEDDLSFGRGTRLERDDMWRGRETPGGLRQEAREQHWADQHARESRYYDDSKSEDRRSNPFIPWRDRV